MAIDSIQGTMPAMGMQFGRQALTDEKREEITSILSGYDATSLTEEDARSINEAFRDAGVRPGRELKQIVEQAGFDADVLGTPAPPPPGPPPGPPKGDAGVSGGLNRDTLSELLGILDEYDVNDMTTNQEEELLNRLDTAGLLVPGLVINQRV